MRQLPHQYGYELRHLHDEALGGERQPLRLLPQRFLHVRRHQRRAGHGLICRPRGDDRTRLHHLPRQRGHDLHQLGRRRLCPSAERHQLLELPQRHDRDRQHHAAAYPGDRRPVQQLPHQYGDEFRHLHDDPFGGERQPLRRLPQRLVHRARHQGRDRARRHIPATWRPMVRTASPATPARPRPSPVGRAATYVHQPSDTNCSSCHNGTTATGNTTPPHIPVTGVQCSNCHTNTATSFVTYTMTHSAVSASRCDCLPQRFVHLARHQGRAGNRVISGPRGDLGGATASPATPPRPRPSPVGRAATYIHQPSDTNCSTCHNGITPLG